MKRLIVLCLTVSLLMSVAIAPSYATDSYGSDNSDVAVCSLYYQNANASLSISTSGMSTAKGYIVGIAGTTTKVTIHLYLQKYSGGKWVNVDDWTKSATTTSMTFTQQKQVSKGYKYRVKASCYAYSGAKSESVVKYSTTVTY